MRVLCQPSPDYIWAWTTPTSKTYVYLVNDKYTWKSFSRVLGRVVWTGTRDTLAEAKQAVFYSVGAI